MNTGKEILNNKKDPKNHRPQKTLDTRKVSRVFFYSIGKI